MLGQIATFMDNLHLSYEDVVYRIPYRNLVIMHRDKMHVVHGTKINKVSGKSMAERRMKMRNGNKG